MPAPHGRARVAAIGCAPGTGENSPACPCPVPFVTTNEDPGIVAAVAYLAAAGHVQAALLTGPPGSRFALDRSERWRRHAAARGLALAPDDVVAAHDTFEDGARATRSLGAAGRLGPGAATALLAGNDLMALGALEALHASGVEVPGDVSVVGFDDVPAARWSGLATVRQGARELGAAAMLALAQHLGAAPASAPPALVSGFVPRRSVGPVPRR